MPLLKKWSFSSSWSQAKENKIGKDSELCLCGAHCEWCRRIQASPALRTGEWKAYKRYYSFTYFSKK